MEEEAKREEWAEMSGLCFIHLLGMQKDRNGADPHLALSRSASPIASQTLWHQNVRRTKTVFASAGGMLAPKAPTMASPGVSCYL
ncbi:hypothetical protein AV530_013135 [Patagioenas fasciata monilis]|uniref:Uncharacterized protein n=1 Tax=Patagioenas fasciata monilis TaxID=372326 RepID=A0A1V4JA97_PATFA|nr:hypothetical protein AV530_013135 [Patagioenas fasciata monilis]